MLTDEAIVVAGKSPESTKQVERNKGSHGVDGMPVEITRAHPEPLETHSC